MALRDLQLFVVDAFTQKPFAGNPAAVCVLQHQLEDAAHLRIAAEMNLSETAFVRPRGTSDYDLRWFTPKVEVDLCGHATLASAAVLFHELKVATGALRFHTKSGVLTAEKEQDKIRLDFPANASESIVAPPALVAAVGGRPRHAEYSPTTKKLLLEYGSPAEVKQLSPDYFAMLRADASPTVQGVIATAKGAPPFDFVSRYFAPWVGINEDPVTGSAHTVLAPYWSRKLGKTTMRARQDSARGGELDVRLVGERVHMVGDAVTVVRGNLSA